jgi:DNA-binding NtrC family response regulator
MGRWDLVGKGLYRADLFYRLSGVDIHVPPLREQREDVRELERLMERAITLVPGTRIELEDLPPHVCGRYGEVLGPSIVASESMRAWGSRDATPDAGGSRTTLVVVELAGRTEAPGAHELGHRHRTDGSPRLTNPL